MLGWMSEDFASRGVASPRLDAELLLASALGGGLLALPRYLNSLTPFVCVAMAAGSLRITRSWLRVNVAACLLLGSLVVTTAIHLARLPW